jgi:hypothetical protein
MTQYLEHGFTLTDKQLKQIANADKKRSGVKLKLGHAQLVGDHKLLVTKTQQNHIAKNYNAGVGVVLDLSAKQLKKTVSGGILPLLTLIPLFFGGLAAAGGVAGGISAAVQAANTKKAEEARQREYERHNRVSEAQESQALKAAVQGAGLVTSACAKNTGKGKGKRKCRSKTVAGKQQGGCEASMSEASQCPTCKGTGLYLGKQFTS